MEIDSETISSVRELLSEVISQHSDPKAPEYNDCDVVLCDWCEQARQVLERIKL